MNHFFLVFCSNDIIILELPFYHQDITGIKVSPLPYPLARGVSDPIARREVRPSFLFVSIAMRAKGIPVNNMDKRYSLVGTNLDADVILGRVLGTIAIVIMPERRSKIKKRSRRHGHMTDACDISHYQKQT